MPLDHVRALCNELCMTIRIATFCSILLAGCLLDPAESTRADTLFDDGGAGGQDGSAVASQPDAGTVDGAILARADSAAPGTPDASLPRLDAAAPTGTVATFNFTIEILGGGGYVVRGLQSDKVDVYFGHYVMGPLAPLILNPILPTRMVGDKVIGTLRISLSQVSLAVSMPAGVSTAVIAGVETSIASDIDSKSKGVLFSTSAMTTLTMANLMEIGSVGAATPLAYVGFRFATMRGPHRSLILACELPFIEHMDLGQPGGGPL
jgi:hypothetical protein